MLSSSNSSRGDEDRGESTSGSSVAKLTDEQLRLYGGMAAACLGAIAVRDEEWRRLTQHQVSIYSFTYMY